MATAEQHKKSEDTVMADEVKNHRSAATSVQKQPPNAKQSSRYEAHQPVLLEWKNREVADDLSKLMMSTAPKKSQAGTNWGDVEMEDR